VYSGRSFKEDICDLLAAKAIFISASSLTANLVLLGSAERVFTPLPAEHFGPGLPFLGFQPQGYLSELCDVFGGAVVGYQPEWEYFMGDTAPKSAAAGSNYFQGVSAAMMRDFSMERIRARRCGG